MKARAAIRTSSQVLACLALAASALAQARAGETVEPSPEARRGWLRRDGQYGFYFRAGGLFIAPTGQSGEVEMTHVSGMARLSGMTDGPIAGSSTHMGSNLMPAATLGYAPPILNRQLSIETILALPFSQKLYAGGTLASSSLAPLALDSLPTGVPPLGTDLGEVKVLPPVVTAVYRFLPGSRVRPYLGAGACVLFVLDTKITNPVLSEVSPPKLEVPPKVGWVIQAGIDVRLWKSLFIRGDFKYIGGLDLTATMKDIWVRLPALPLYEAVRVGDNTVQMSVNPVVAQIGLGLDL